MKKVIRIGKKVVAEEQLEMFPGELPEQVPNTSLGDVLKDFSTEWENWGDVNFVEYGGSQVKFDPKFNEWEIVELGTPDSGYPGFYIQETSVSLDDIFDTIDLDEPAQWHVPSKDAMGIASFMGAENDWDEGNYANFISSVVLGWLPYYGGSDTAYWTFEDYAEDPDNVTDEELEEIEDEIRNHLQKVQGITEGL